MQTSRRLSLKALVEKFRPKLKERPIGSSDFVKIVQVGPRDGLQNEKKILSVEEKLDLINRLSLTGLKSVEVGSFVSPKWIPQMANSKEVYQAVQKVPGVSYPCLVPNEKGLKQALLAGVSEIAIFASATQGFSKANLNCSVDQSLEKYRVVTDQAKKAGLRIRGYISMVIECPYDGHTNPDKVRNVVQKLFRLGCYEVSLGDTIGKGNPSSVRDLLTRLKEFPKDQIGMHFHDTFDNALENIAEGISMGYNIVDSSVGGLGGCPYSMKPVGNVCTENVVTLCHELGLETGVDYEKISRIGDEICEKLGRPNIRIV